MAAAQRRGHFFCSQLFEHCRYVFPISQSPPVASYTVDLGSTTKDNSMRVSTPRFCLALALLLASPAASSAQASSLPLSSIPPIPFDISGSVIRSHAEPAKPFTVAGERGVVLGHQDGTFEAWILPVKLLSHLTIEANVEGYTVPIDVNQPAAQIEVRPDRTTLTYSHIGFTIRQIMFSPNAPPAGSGAQTGPMVLFEFDCVRPTDFTFRFTPELRWMWPERNEGVPGVEWVSGNPGGGAGAQGTSGYYILHSDYPD